MTEYTLNPDGKVDMIQPKGAGPAKIAVLPDTVEQMLDRGWRLANDPSKPKAPPSKADKPKGTQDDREK